MILDSARAGDDKLLFASSSGAENTGTDRVKFTDTGFQILDSSGGFNTNGETYIYAAFGDRAGNNWTPNNLIHGPTTKTFTAEKPDGSAWGNIANAFDGNTSNYADGTSSNGATSKIIFNPPLTGVTSLRLYWYGTSNYGYNDTNIGTGSTTAEWKSVYSGSATTVNNIIGISQAGMGVIRLYAIEVNGTVLTEYTDLDPADIDSMIDTPMNITADSGNNPGNYATLNPLNKHNSNNTLSNGNLEFTTSGSDGCLQESTIGMSSGKFYFEVVYSAGSTGQLAGIRKPGSRNYDNSYIYTGTANKYTNGGSGASYGAGLANGDVIGTAFDADNGTLTFYKNGVSQGQAFSGISGTYSFLVGSFGGPPTGIVNFGQRPFAYTPPTNHKSLCTQNLPDPTIADGSTAFDALTYAGSSSPQTVSGLSFASDLIWIKSRSHTAWHILQDSIRGFGKTLFSNSTTAEVGNANDLISNVSATGFSVNTNYNSGTDTATTTTSGSNSYVAWAWDAGSSNTSISAGSLNSSVYDQSQTWSSGITSGSSPNSSYGVANAFNGGKTGLNNTCFVNNGSHVQVDFTTLSSASTVTVHYTANGSGVLKVNGTNQAIDGSGSNVYRSVTVNVSGLSSVRWEQADGSNFVGVSGIEVDGKLLVDNGITLANLPAIASTVRANPSAGFSVVKFEGDRTAGSTVGHGLNAAPELVIVKNRESTSNWMVYHKDAGHGGYLSLNTNAAYASASSVWNNTAPTSSVFTLGADSESNGNGSDMIAYCFTSVENYSSIGSFVGNGTTDNSFVYTGFLPKFILLKYSSHAGDWLLLDTSRRPNGPSGGTLVANVANAEDGYYTDTQANIDFLSNGFKIRVTGSPFGDSGRTVVYAAFAEHPFKYSRAY